MKFLSYRSGDRPGIAVAQGEAFKGLTDDQPRYPGSLLDLIRAGAAALAQAGDLLASEGDEIDPNAVTVLPPVMPGKIVCVGLNYADHAAESNMQVPAVPTIFSRFASTIIGPYDAIRLPRVSTTLDFEGELAAVIGTRGRYIAKADALDHVAGYAAFNDATLRDYQLRTPQWTIGKNFDGTGPFGPVFVTADALPAGGSGLAIQTRLNGEVMQRSTTDQLIFDVASLVATASEAMTLEPGDVIITGTPAGVGGARKPQVFMKAGDVCEVEIEGIGTIINRIAAEACHRTCRRRHRRRPLAGPVHAGGAEPRRGGAFLHRVRPRRRAAAGLAAAAHLRQSAGVGRDRRRRPQGTALGPLRRL